MKLKKLLGVVSLAAILICGVYAAGAMYQSGPSYEDSRTNLMELYQHPESYNTTDPDSVADVIVKENLEKTEATNVVFSVVYNFRGYDTIGESFILIAALTGSMVILRKTHKDWNEKKGV